MKGFIHANETRYKQICRDKVVRDLLYSIEEQIEELIDEEHENPVTSLVYKFDSVTFENKKNCPALITNFLKEKGYNVFTSIDHERQKYIMNISW